MPSILYRTQYVNPFSLVLWPAPAYMTCNFEPGTEDSEWVTGQCLLENGITADMMEMWLKVAALENIPDIDHTLEKKGKTTL